MNKPGYAVKKDLTFWRIVDGATPDPENPEKVYMDPDTEYFMSFEDGPPPAPLPATEELAANAMHECDRLLAIAAIRIAPLQDAADLGTATSDGVALLRAWKEYRVALSAIPESKEFPNKIIWPELPTGGNAS